MSSCLLANGTIFMYHNGRDWMDCLRYIGGEMKACAHGEGRMGRFNRI